MHLTTLLTLGLAYLFTQTLTLTLPHNRGVPLPARTPGDEAHTYTPTTVLWHASASLNATLASSGNSFPAVDGAASVSACGAPAYDHTSTARTAVVRDDCYALALKVAAAPGFWELYKWTREGDEGGKGKFIPLVSDGTCEFAVKRRDVPVGFNASTSDVVIIGDHDVVKVLNASVYDLAHAADEPYVDAERNQGHMDCKWWFSVNATMEFRIQKTGTD